MQDRKKQIAFGAALSYISIAFNIIAGLIYTPWMVRQIGQSEYGLYTLATTLITLFLVDFGLSSATARYVSRYHAEGNEEKANTFLGTIYQLYLIIDAVIFLALLIVFLFADSIYRSLTPEELRQFKIVYLIAAGYSIINFPFVTLNGVLTAHELFIQQKLADLIQRALTILLVVIALIKGMGLYALVAANAVSGLTVILFKLITIRKHTDIRVRFRQFDKPLLKELFGFSVWSTIGALSSRLIFNITPSILGMVASSSAIAVFGIVTVIEGYTYTITNAISGMFMPKISRIVVGNDTESSLQPLLIRVGKFQYALNGLIVAGFVVLGRDFIRLWMGEQYLSAYIGIVLVTLPGLFYNALQIGHTTVIVQNKVKITALVSLLCGLINVVLSFFLSQKLGVTGASLSIFIAYIVRALVLSLLYHKKLDLDILDFCKKCYLRLSPAVVCTIGLGFLWVKLLPTYNWLRLGCGGVVVCLTYSILLPLFGLDASEKRAALQMIKRHLLK